MIGLELIPRLVMRGYSVMVGDLKPRPPSFPKEVTYRHGDLNEITQAELDAFSPDIIIHLAATFERSDETYGFWDDCFQHNVRLSHHLMTLARNNRLVKRVVFASSYLIYDPSLYQFDAPQDIARPLREEDRIYPRNLTGMAKLAHEIELRFLQHFGETPFSSVCVRIFRGYGRNSRDIVSRWVRLLLSGQPITVYRPEGIFDYIYAADAAEGLLRLGENSACTGVINLGTGKARRVADVVSILKDHFPTMDIVAGHSDIAFEASQADISKLHDSIGWLPEYDLEKAIPEIIAHERGRAHASVSFPQVAPRVLVSSASRKVPLLRAMDEAARAVHPDARVVAGDLSPDAIAAHVSPLFWAMPSTVDSELASIIEGCRSRGITVVLPTRDGELMFWSRHAEALRSAGIDVIVSAPGPIERCLDKLAFSRFGIQQRLPFIPTTESLADLPGEAFVVKERFGAGSRSIGINLSRLDALDHAERLELPIFQPYIVGREVSVDAWLDRDFHVKGLSLRHRDSVSNGESQITTTFRDTTLEREAAEILERLQLNGPVVMQLIVDTDGRLHVVECNARFGGASTASIKVGVDSLRWSLLESCGADMTLHPFHRAATEVRQIRVPADVHVYDPRI